VALIYSPLLHSAQVELLETAKGLAEIQPAALDRVAESQKRLYGSARQRLTELGMTESQVLELEETGQASIRLPLVAPISGTVIEQLAVEGQYIETGEPIYRVADLSSVWLLLELFPEDASSIRYGQRVEAEAQSRPGHRYAGRVAFIDPIVNAQTRTIGVRVVIQNDRGLLRIGDYAHAEIQVDLSASADAPARVYDEELAGKWISPRHPHVIEAAPGECRLCGIDLVPASQFGFADEPTEADDVLGVPRNAVLMAGDNSVVYVETEPGRFEIRPVVLGPSLGDRIVIREGVAKGESVAVSGNFLIDSQMQLAGKPSVIDPARAVTNPATAAKHSLSAEHRAALAQLSPEDRTLAERQKICPVAGMPLGSMGTPVKVQIDGRTVFLCCKGCEGPLRASPEKYLSELPQEADP
jgi:Cu(I)/Ag(I) efflux system membrane fusion protein